MGNILAEEFKQKRYEQELLDKVTQRLEEAIALEAQGKKEESDKVLTDMKKWLEDISNGIKNNEKNEKGHSTLILDFPKNGEKLVAGHKVILGTIRHEEKEKYLAVSREYSFAKGMYNDEKFCETVWEEFISDNSFVASIYDINSGAYVGYCSIKNLAKKEWELAIELKKDECHKGYGSEALMLFMKYVSELTERRFFRVRVEIDNHASQGLMRKLGATPNGISEFMLHGEEIERFKEEHKDMITEEIREVAEEFCMEAEEILGYVLEYRFDVKSLKI